MKKEKYDRAKIAKKAKKAAGYVKEALDEAMIHLENAGLNQDIKLNNEDYYNSMIFQQFAFLVENTSILFGSPFNVNIERINDKQYAINVYFDNEQLPCAWEIIGI